MSSVLREVLFVDGLVMGVLLPFAAAAAALLLLVGRWVGALFLLLACFVLCGRQGASLWV